MPYTYVSCHTNHCYIFFSNSKHLSHLKSLATRHAFKANVRDGRRGEIKGETIRKDEGRKRDQSGKNRLGQTPEVKGKMTCISIQFRSFSLSEEKMHLN